MQTLSSWGTKADVEAAREALKADIAALHTPIPLATRHAPRTCSAGNGDDPGLSPLEETRTPTRGCKWLATCRVGGNTYAEVSRHGCSHDLARTLINVAGGHRQLWPIIMPILREASPGLRDISPQIVDVTGHA